MLIFAQKLVKMPRILRGTCGGVGYYPYPRFSNAKYPCKTMLILSKKGCRF